ncbi:MAG TPA: hypothetical protein VHD32_13820 [Candidatus Didemnitutus sp.]|nr:hypothetical protein [Candidatus Didemnitutus sp.]
MNSAAQSPYRPLARPLGASQLWKADDHLLLVRTIGWTESYRRFYFRDIQAILVVHTNRRIYWNLGLLGGAFIVVILVHAGGGQWLSDAIIAAVFLPLLIRNNLAGPGCRTVLTTAVQDEKIPCLRRLRKTRRVIEEIRPLIRGAQADLAGDSVPPVTPVPATPPPGPVSENPPPPEIPPPVPT